MGTLEFIICWFIVIPIIFAPAAVLIFFTIAAIIHQVRNGTKFHIAVFRVLFAQHLNSMSSTSNLPNKPEEDINNKSTDFTNSSIGSHLSDNIHENK